MADQWAVVNLDRASQYPPMFLQSQLSFRRTELGNDDGGRNENALGTRFEKL